MVAVINNELIETEKNINNNINNINIKSKEEKMEKEEVSNGIKEEQNKMEVDEENNEATTVENEDDKSSIGLTSDEDDTKIMEDNNVIENKQDNIEENNKEIVKSEENNISQNNSNNNIDNKSIPIENIENNRVESTKIQENIIVSDQVNISSNNDTNNNNNDNGNVSLNSQNQQNSQDHQDIQNQESSQEHQNLQNQQNNDISSSGNENEQKKRHMPRYETSVCSLIIKTMERQPNSIPFLKPVDPVALNIPDYFNVIKHPMDFSTILKKLKKGEYPSMNEYVDDVDLVFKNCMTYNPPNNPVHKMGQEMKTFFIEQLKKYPEHFTNILLNKFDIDLTTIENSERRPRRQVRPPQHFEPEDEILMKRLKQQQKREQNEMKAFAAKQEEEIKNANIDNLTEEVNDPIKASKASKSAIAKAQKVRKAAKKAAKVAAKATAKKRAKKRSYSHMDDDVDDEEEIIENMEDLYDSSTDSEDELVESQITALTACLQQVQQQLELLQAQSNMSRHARKKSRRSISSFSEYYSNSEKETPISSKALAAAHRRISSTSNTLPNPPSTKGRKKQNTMRKTAITNSALQNTGTRKRSKTKSETNSPAKRSPANSQGKVCEYCGGSETPMWRRGPSGKGSLCNKCGVKWKSGKIYKGEPIPSQSASNTAASSVVSTPNINSQTKMKRQKIEAPPKKPRVQSITYAQKKELSEMIGKLDEDNLNGVIDIIRSGIPDLKDGQEEIELDIETIDPVTLRKLYRYVKKVFKPVKVVQKPINQELQNLSDYSSNESSDSGDESNDGE